MIQLDALASVHPRKCPNCLTTFHNKDSRRIYCSKHCQDQFKLKNFRAREKAQKATAVEEHLAELQPPNQQQPGERADKPKQPKVLGDKQHEVYQKRANVPPPICRHGGTDGQTACFGYR